MPFRNRYTGLITSFPRSCVGMHTGKVTRIHMESLDAS